MADKLNAAKNACSGAISAKMKAKEGTGDTDVIPDSIPELINKLAAGEVELGEVKTAFAALCVKQIKAVSIQIEQRKGSNKEYVDATKQPSQTRFVCMSVSVCECVSTLLSLPLLSLLSHSFPFLPLSFSPSSSLSLFSFFVANPFLFFSLPSACHFAERWTACLLSGLSCCALWATCCTTLCPCPITRTTTRLCAPSARLRSTRHGRSTRTSTSSP